MFRWSDSDKIAIPIMLGCIILVSVALFFILRNKNEKIKRIPFKIISLSLIILEVVKQIYFISTGTYTARQIPAHFCSLIVIIIALNEFLPKKFSKWLDASSVVFPIIALVLLLVDPKSMIGSSSSNIFKNFPTFHAFMFHALVVAYPILKLTTIKIEHNLKYCFTFVGIIVFYASYAVPIAFKFNHNYINILKSAFPPLEKFRLACGQLAYDLVLFVIGVSVSILIYLIWYFIEKLVKKRRNKNAT